MISLFFFLFHFYCAGGGMLAHTIIGIAFDSKTGESHYLVLDPHYTGGEDLSTVQNKV